MQVFFRRMAWLLLLGVAVVTVSPIGLRPVTGAPADVERALAFGLIGAAVWLGYPRHRAVVLLVIALAGLLEAAQSLVPGRHGRMHDFVVKGAGAVAGAVLAALVERTRPGEPDGRG